MIHIIPSDLDNSNFIDIVQSIINGFINDLNPHEIFLITVDNWFDKKWLNFQGKVLGAVGTWRYLDESRIPPFNPNRILEEKCFKSNNSSGYDRKVVDFNIHIRQHSEDNRQRKITEMSDSAIFIWYSSNTKQNNHGSLMIYPIINGHCNSFYIGFQKQQDWKIINCLGINRKVVINYL